MKSYNLAICVPTYNRFKNLSIFFEHLSKISTEILSDIQIRIYDNNSTDATAEIVKAQSSEFNIYYKKQSSNLGAIKNVINIFEESKKSKFIWVLGDDDYINVNAFEGFYSKYIKGVSEKIWYVVDFMYLPVESELNNKKEHNEILKSSPQKRIDSILYKYGPSVFGFLGSHIFSANSIDENFFNQNFENNSWPHISLLVNQKRKIVFNSSVLSLKGGDAYWESVTWYKVKLSILLSYDQSYFNLMTRIGLSLNYILSRDLNKFLIIARAGGKNNMQIIIDEISEMIKMPLKLETKLILNFVKLFAKTLVFAPNRFFEKYNKFNVYDSSKENAKNRKL